MSKRATRALLLEQIERLAYLLSENVDSDLVYALGDPAQYDERKVACDLEILSDELYASFGDMADEVLRFASIVGVSPDEYLHARENQVYDLITYREDMSSIRRCALEKLHGLESMVRERGDEIRKLQIELCYREKNQ